MKTTKQQIKDQPNGHLYLVTLWVLALASLLFDQNAQPYVAAAFVISYMIDLNDGNK